MVLIDEVLEFLNTLIHFATYNTIQISKDSRSEFQTYLQYAQENIEFLHLELQLQRDELQQHKHHFELVFVKNNPLFEVEIDTHKFPTSDQMSEPKVN